MPPRRQPPAAPSESKAGLVIALVFFILTTLTAGVMAYLFYGNSEKMIAEKDKALADTKTFQRVATQLVLGQLIDTQRRRL